MSSSSSSSRFSKMFSYYSSRLDSMWVIISKSSIITPNFGRSPFSSSRSVIQYSGSLGASSNFIFANFLHSLVLEGPVVGSNFLDNFIHACLDSPCLFSFCFLFFHDLKIDRIFLCEYDFVVGCLVK